MAKKEDGSPLRVRFMKRLRRILWGEVCISCGDRGAGDELLCAACAAKFQRKLAEKCPDCGSPRFECYCAPPRLRDAGCEFLAKLASYDASEADCPLNRVIWRQKHVRDRECAAFLAGLLAVPAGELLDGQGVDRSHLIVTYVPRDPGKILADGHDQARLLAEALAEKLGAPCVRLISRKSGSSEQKNLSADERDANVKKLFSLSKEGAAASLDGMTVLMVDDLVTTGATAAACVGLLRAAGAEVFCAAVAYTAKRGRCGRIPLSVSPPELRAEAPQQCPPAFFSDRSIHYISIKIIENGCILPRCII